MHILILHGPNLNLIGEREVDLYGKLTLDEINSRLQAFAEKKRITLRIFQSNGEGQLIDAIHENRNWAQGMIINPGAYTHYSYAIRDAISAIQIPTVEVHLTNINTRKKFRRNSVIAPVCIDQIAGMGWKSYIEGIRLLLKMYSKLTKQKKPPKKPLA